MKTFTVTDCEFEMIRRAIREKASKESSRMKDSPFNNLLIVLPERVVKKPEPFYITNKDYI